MQGQEFQRWVTHGLRDYGGDPWQLVRELAQNSRDAGAGTIRVEARAEAGREQLIFTDDGDGMSFAHARRFLFRLYASSKSDDARSAGEFGIGFWTVLRFGADQLRIESHDGAASWAVLLDAELRPARCAVTLEARGTRICLSRPAREEPGRFREEVRGALLRFCSHLLRRGRGRAPLAVLFEGEDLHRELIAPGPLSLRFDHGALRGVVGLAPSPHVQLLVRGLPVWEGTVLDELVHAGVRRPARGELARGLAPVFVLDGDRLQVERSRTGVVDDRQLRRLRRSAERALGRLVDLHLRRSLPRSALCRAWDRLAYLLEAWLLPRARYLVMGSIYLVLLGVILYLLLAPVDRARPTPGVTAAPSAAPTAATSAAAPPIPSAYAGAQIDAFGAPAPFTLSYAPPSARWLRLFALERYDARRGFVPRPLVDPRPAPSYSCRRGCVELTLRPRARGRAALPIPIGHRLETDSVRVDGEHAPGPRLGPNGALLVELERDEATVTYRTGPAAETAHLDPATRLRLLQLPVEALPAELSAPLTALSQAAPARRAKRALQLIGRRLRYDRDPASAQRFARLSREQGWLAAVLEIGGGDCDMINGVLVLMLRSAGLPSRLVAGVAGERGALSGALHAWAEYYDRGWRRVDATEVTPLAPGPVIARDHPATTARGVAPAGPARPVAEPSPRARLEPSGTSADAEPTRGRAGSAAPSSAATTAGTASAGASPADTAPVDTSPADTTPGDPRRPRRQARALFAVGGLVAAGAVIALLVFGPRSLWRWRRRENFHAPSDDRDSDALLARMLAGAEADPGAWGGAHLLWRHPVLPTLDGARLSITRARHLAKSGRLAAGTRRSALTRAALDAARPVLDLDAPIFTALASGLPGVVILDQLDALRPVDAASLPAGPGRELLADLELLLARCGAPEVGCLPVRHQISRTFRDIDLSRLRLPANAGWPRRFVAVDPESALWRACAAARGRHPQLALFTLLTSLLRSSLLLLGHADQLRRRAARRLLEEMAP